MNLKSKTLLFIVLAIGSACTAAPPTLLATAWIEPTVTPSILSPDVLLELAGDSFTNSNSFQMKSPGKLEVTWTYSGQGSFAVWIQNIKGFVLDPNSERVLIKDVKDVNTSGKATVELMAGEYEIEVELADGPWTILVKSSP